RRAGRCAPAAATLVGELGAERLGALSARCPYLSAPSPTAELSWLWLTALLLGSGHQERQGITGRGGRARIGSVRLGVARLSGVDAA
ncbi:MAG: hypothetical protein ACRDTT_26365, partial [Pseudonocardiaceae bacterium]